MTFDFDDIGGIALRFSVSQDIQGRPILRTLTQGSCHLHPKVFSKDLGHERQGHTLGKTTKLLTNATDLLTQFF